MARVQPIVPRTEATNARGGESWNTDESLGDRAFALLDLLPQPAFAVAVDADNTFRFLHLNPPCRELLELADDLEVRDDLRAVLPADSLVTYLRHFARAAGDGRPVSFEVDLADGTRSVSIDVAPVRDNDGRCAQLLGVAHDVTEYRRIESLLAHRTRHDPLTELPNRVLLGERLVESLERARVLRQQVGLVLLDIDGFKLVNDSLGHAVGDEVLAIAAQRIEHVLRSGDTLARVGGDELAILCNHVVQLSDVVALAERVRAVFDEPFSLDSGDLFLTASLGIAVSDGPFDSADRLFRDADVAMFAAKDLGRGGIEVFAAAMRDRVVNRLEVEAGLRQALARGEFVVHYQPLIRFDEAEVIGFEALVRWDHPEKGIIAPLDFLPVAEETGLIVPIGEWVLGEACGQAARWGHNSPHERPLTMAVNLSAGQLNDPDLVAMVQRALATAGLDASLLVLEITEDVLMHDREHAIRVLRELSSLGVRIGIDDFGTGQSSLGYLRSLPVHTLKIDRSFIDGLGVSPEDSAIVAAVVHLGHALGLSVTAEGVETPRQVSELRALGCDLGQGYYFAHPQPGEIVQALVHHRYKWRQRDVVA